MKMHISMRVSLWRANSERCLYCENAIAFRDLEIDHVIPESTDALELARLVTGLGLEPNFSLSDSRNLVPTHHDCNRKKRATLFNESTLRYYLGLWADRQDKIREEKCKFEITAERDDILAKLAHQIEIGAISQEQISGLLQSLTVDQFFKTPSPTVLSFGMMCDDLQIAEKSQQQLITKLRATFKRPLIAAERFQFTGETLSVRLAVWNFDVDKIESLDLGKWELLEVDAASDLYGEESSRELGDAINNTYNIFYAEKHGCPECGGKVSMGGYAGESGELAIATCETCGWEDYYG